MNESNKVEFVKNESNADDKHVANLYGSFCFKTKSKFLIKYSIDVDVHYSVDVEYKGEKYPLYSKYNLSNFDKEVDAYRFIYNIMSDDNAISKIKDTVIQHSNNFLNRLVENEEVNHIKEVLSNNNAFIVKGELKI